MIVRKIRPEEFKRTLELFAIAFEFCADYDKSAEEVFEEISKHPRSREEAYWSERWAAFADDNRTMMSYLIAQPFPVQFDGNIYTMTGIGGVASLPQYRKNGGIRGCFEAALPAMYEDGVAFSYLYPFSTAYYRKFGYEMGCARYRYHIRLDSLHRFDVSGNCILVEDGKSMLPQIEQIYRIWQNRYNMMVANEDYEFSWVIRSNPVKEQVFTYVYQSADNIPMGYMSVKQSMESDGRNLCCTRFCFTCPEGLKGLFNLLIALGTDHIYVTLEVPSDVNLSFILPEWSMGAVSCEKYYPGMVRVIHVEKVLAGAHYLGSGQICIKIIDCQIAQNSGTYQVIFADNQAVSVIRNNQAKPDITMGINEFSHLIIGAGDISSMQYMDSVIIHNPSGCMEQVFYKKPNLILEYF